MSFYRNRYMSSGAIPQIDNDRRGGTPGNDNYTKLLLHCDGIFEGGAFIDSSRVPHAVNVGGGTSVLATYIDNTQSVFGGFSANMVGNTNRFLRIPDSVDWDFEAGDFTIDFRIRFAAKHTGSYVNYIMGQYADSSNYWYMRTAIRAGCLYTVTLNNGGSGYSVGNTLTITQVGASGGTLNVETVAGGVVTGIRITGVGTAYSVADALATTVSPAGGTLCTVNITAIAPYYAQVTTKEGGVTIGNWARGILFNIDTWYHWAFVKNGSNVGLYIDGTLLVSNDTAAFEMPNVAKELLIGQMGYTAGSSIDGWMDEIRISKGIARWTTNFTPPTMAYI